MQQLKDHVFWILEKKSKKVSTVLETKPTEQNMTVQINSHDLVWKLLKLHSEQERSDGGVYRYIYPPPPQKKKSVYLTNFYVVTGCCFSL